jgi:hypothetical protein
VLLHKNSCRLSDLESSLAGLPPLLADAFDIWPHIDADLIRHSLLKTHARE